MIHQTRRAFFIFTDTATRAQEDYSVLPVRIRLCLTISKYLAEPRFIRFRFAVEKKG